jgi:transmembrane sensor
MSDHPRDPAPHARPPADVPDDWAALARQLAGEPPAADDAADVARASAARQWMAAHPDEAARLAEVDALARTHLAPPPSAPVDVEAALARVQRQAFPGSTVRAPSRPAVTSPPPHVRPRPAWATRPRRLVGTGAALTAAALALFITRQRPTAVDPAPTTLAVSRITAVGQRDSLRLSDGTRVVLGPATRLDVPAGYGRGERTVTLDGEAYFAVVHDAARPFTVRAGPAVVRDLGTAFVVRGSHADRVTVAVTEGSVRLETAPPADPAQPGPAQPPARPRRDSSASVLLRAGDRGLVDRPARTPGATPPAARVSRLAPAATPGDELAWTTGRLVFRDAPLDEVSDALRRWYGVELRVTDPALAGRHLTANFRGEPIGEVLRVVGLALGARLDRRADTVFVRATR